MSASLGFDHAYEAAAMPFGKVPLSLHVIDTFGEIEPDDAIAGAMPLGLPLMTKGGQGQRNDWFGIRRDQKECERGHTRQSLRPRSKEKVPTRAHFLFRAAQSINVITFGVSSESSR